MRIYVTILILWIITTISWGSAVRSATLETLIAQTSDSRLSLQREAEEALVALGDEAVDAIIANLGVQKNLFSRSVSARALGRIGNTRALPALIKAASDPTLEVRIEVATALGYFPGKMSTIALQNLARDRFADVRIAALTAIQTRPGEAILSLLIDSLDDVNQRVGLAAVTALSSRGDPAAVPALIALADNPFITFQAADALRSCCTRENAPTLLKALQSPNRYTKAYAILLLGEIGAKDATSTLLPLLTHDDSAIRLSAAQALIALGEIEAPAAALAKSLVGDSTQEQIAAARVIGGLPADSSLPLLELALACKHHFTRINAVLNLAAINHPRADALLLQCLDDPSGDVVEIAHGLLYTRLGKDYGLDSAAWKTALEKRQP
jgi:HEAT repeat protein